MHGNDWREKSKEGNDIIIFFIKFLLKLEVKSLTTIAK